MSSQRKLIDRAQSLLASDVAKALAPAVKAGLEQLAQGRGFSTATALAGPSNVFEEITLVVGLECDARGSLKDEQGRSYKKYTVLAYGDKFIVYVWIDGSTSVPSRDSTTQVTSDARLGADNIFAAIEARDIEGVQRLLNNAPSLATKRARKSDGDWALKGTTPLHHAVEFFNREIMQLLIEHGANVNAAESGGWTPLHFAANEPQPDAIPILVSAGANLRARDSDGRTPLQLAQNKGHSREVALLQKYGAKQEPARSSVAAWVIAFASIAAVILVAGAIWIAANHSVNEVTRPAATRQTSTDFPPNSRIPRSTARQAGSDSETDGDLAAMWQLPITLHYEYALNGARVGTGTTHIDRVHGNYRATYTKRIKVVSSAGTVEFDVLQEFIETSTGTPISIRFELRSPTQNTSLHYSFDGDDIVETSEEDGQKYTRVLTNTFADAVMPVRGDVIGAQNLASNRRTYTVRYLLASDNGLRVVEHRYTQKGQSEHVFQQRLLPIYTFDVELADGVKASESYQEIILLDGRPVLLLSSGRTVAGSWEQKLESLEYVFVKPRDPLLSRLDAFLQPRGWHDAEAQKITASARAAQSRGATFEAAVVSSLAPYSIRPPAHGTVQRHHTAPAIAPLTIVTRGANRYYLVKLQAWDSRHRGDPTVTAIIHSGRTLQLDVPLGSYELKYAMFTSWYGFDRFGPDAVFSRADTRLDFRDEGDHVTGYTIELFLQRDGNLETEELDPEDF